MRPVHIAGSAVHRSWRDDSRNLTELIFAGVSLALADAGLSMADVDGVALGAHDLVDGRGLTSMVTAPAAGAFLRDEVRLSEDGASAFVLGVARVRGGHNEVCLIASWGRTSEGPPDDIARLLFDPFLVRPFGLTEVSVSALRAAHALRAHPDYAAARPLVAARRSDLPAAEDRSPAASPPLLPDDLPVWGDVVSAVVLTAAPAPVRVAGVGLGTEPYALGDRDLLGMPALASAASRAFGMAGIGADEVDWWEIDGLTTVDEALGLEAVGAASPGTGMRMLGVGAVNADGGCRAGYGAPAMGLTRISHAHRALRAGQARHALATGASVVAAQTQAAVVLSRSANEDVT